MKKSIFKNLFFCFLSLFILSHSAVALQPTKEMGNIARIAAALTARQHYRQQPIDDRISSTLFDEYFKTLDPNKLYLTQRDINKFKSYRNKLDDQIHYGQIKFAFEAFNKLVEKVKYFDRYTDVLLKKGFDFSKKESFMIDRSKLPWAKNNEELKDVWRKKIKNDILTYRLMDKARKEKELEETKKEKKPEVEKKSEDKKINIHSSWKNKTPEERVRKRVSQYLNYLQQNEPINVLELYLSTLKKIYDPHSAYMSPQSEEDFNISMKLSLVGIGALLTTEDGYTKIVKLIPGGPAEKDAQLESEDRIIAVAQENSEHPVDIVDMPLSKVVRMIRGQKNTKVHLTVLKGSEGIHAIPKVISLTRDTVKLKESEVKGEIKEIKSGDGKTLKIGVISIPSFYIDFKAAFEKKKDYKSSTRDVRKLLESFEKENINGLIIDIRSNGGGSLREAIELTGLFIRKGPVVQVRNHTGKIDKKYDPDNAIYYSGPLLVLTNIFSASASEIFAGAIQDYSRGLIVGDSHTHGKGTVQTIYELAPFLSIFGLNFPAGSLKLTTAKFYRINGASTQEKGVAPDIIFPSFGDSMKVGEKHLDHVLPWDAINPEDHQIYNPSLDNSVPEINRRSLERRKSSNKFKLLKHNIKKYEEIRNRKTVPLNEQERWSSYLNEKKIQEEQNKLLKIDNNSSDKKEDKNKKEDLYLDESLNILKDYIELSDLKNKSDNNKKK